MRFPYILFAWLHIYNQLFKEPDRSDIAYCDAFVYQETIGNKMEISYTGDILLTYSTLQIQSAEGMFWFKTGKAHTIN